MYELKLPDLGEGIHEGEILKWHVEPGQMVEEDAPLVDVETDKAAVTIPSPAAGKLVSVGGKVGEIVTVGSIIAVIDDGSATAAVARAADAAPAPAATSQATAPPAPPRLAEPTVPAAPGRPVPAAPATRRLARELGVDLRQVAATGPAGRVTPGDVRRHAGGTQPAPSPAGAAIPAEADHSRAPDTSIPFLDLEPLPDFSQWGPVEIEALRSIRRKVAHKMTTAKILVPHVAHMDDADVTDLEQFRRKERQRRVDQDRPGSHLTLMAFVVKAVTAGLRAAPAFNASLDPFLEQIVYKKYYNIGFAADTGRGLVVPVIRETDRKSIIAIASDIEQLAQRAREGTLQADEMRGGTFTITNVGPLGGTALIPAINYPEVAILGMGKAQEKPVVRDGQIVIRTILPLTLAFDHRIADGADAARFVSELVRHLSDPNLLLLET